MFALQKLRLAVWCCIVTTYSITRVRSVSGPSWRNRERSPEAKVRFLGNKRNWSSRSRSTEPFALPFTRAAGLVRDDGSNQVLVCRIQTRRAIHQVPSSICPPDAACGLAERCPERFDHLFVPSRTPSCAIAQCLTCADRGCVTLVGPSANLETSVVRGRDTLVGLSAGRSPWPVVRVRERFDSLFGPSRTQASAPR